MKKVVVREEEVKLEQVEKVEIDGLKKVAKMGVGVGF